MIKDYMETKLKSVHTYVCIIILVLFAVLGVVFPEVSSLTGINDSAISGMLPFTSIYSQYTMSMLIIPIFLFWISRSIMRKQNVLYQVRFVSTNRIAVNKIWWTFMESLCFNLIVFCCVVIRFIGLQAGIERTILIRLPAVFILQVLGFFFIAMIVYGIYEWKENMAVSLLLGYFVSLLDFIKLQGMIRIPENIKFFTSFSLYRNPFYTVVTIGISYVYMIILNMIAIIIYFNILKRKQYYGRDIKNE